MQLLPADSISSDIDPPLTQEEVMLQLISRGIDGDLGRAERVELLKLLATNEEARSLVLSMIALEEQTLHLAVLYDTLVPPDEMAARALAADAPWNQEPSLSTPWSRRPQEDE